MGEQVSRQELRQFTAPCGRLAALWRVARDAAPLVAAIWRYHRGLDGLPVADIVERDSAPTAPQDAEARQSE